MTTDKDENYKSLRFETLTTFRIRSPRLIPLLLASAGGLEIYATREIAAVFESEVIRPNPVASKIGRIPPMPTIMTSIYAQDQFTYDYDHHVYDNMFMTKIAIVTPRLSRSTSFYLVAANQLHRDFRILGLITSIGTRHALVVSTRGQLFLSKELKTFFVGCRVINPGA